MTSPAKYPQSPVPGCAWFNRTQQWRVRIQQGPHAGNYGYFNDQSEAEDVARLAAVGLLKPGTRENPTTKRTRKPRPSSLGPLHTVRRAPVTPTQANSRSKSGVRGVSWHAQENKWHVRVRGGGRYRSYGLYTTLEEAARVAQRAYSEVWE